MLSPNTMSFLIGAGSIATAGLITWIGIQLVRLWHLPKRVDRIERIIPPIARGIWALLGEHVRQNDGNSTPEIAEAYSKLTEVVTESVVSQKEKR